MKQKRKRNKAAIPYRNDVKRQDVSPIMNVTAAANAIFPISPVAANIPIFLPSCDGDDSFATAENAIGWNIPNAMLPSMKAANIAAILPTVPRRRKPML